MDWNYSPDERETHINYDYVDKVVHISVTYEHLWNNLLKRTKNVVGRTINKSTHTITIPLSACRQPTSVLRTPRKPVKTSTNDVLTIESPPDDSQAV